MSEETSGGIILPNQRTNKQWTSYLATAYAEGFCEGEGASVDEQIEAWAYLIKTKICYQLQGWFGSNAKELIRKGYIDEDGTINWNILESSQTND